MAIGGEQFGAHHARDRSRQRTGVFWLVLLATVVLAIVSPATASESSGAAAWGLNNDSQLGNGTTTTEKEAVSVKVLTEATAVVGGEFHSLALLKSGKVMAWGENADGQLGNGTTTTEKEPVEVKGITEAVAIAAGSDHSLAVLKSGKVLAWGENNDGQLGNGTTTTEKEPVEVKGITEAAGVAAGHNHSLAVLKTGKVEAWGDNNDGQLGNGTTTTEKEPVEVKGLTEAAAVAGGAFHSLALLQSGKVKAWGENNDGQLGNGTTTDAKEPVEVKGLSGATGGVAAGANFSLASYASKPANTALPTISGEAKDEKTLTASTGTWTGTPTITYSYQWESCNTKGESCVNISSATSATYTIAHEQVGHTLRVKVTAKNGAAEPLAISVQTAVVAASAPTNTVLPVISGEAKDEQTFSASTGTWAGSPAITYGYQWESCNTSGESCSNISGATGSSRTIAHEQVGHTLRVKVTATNSAGEASVISAQTAVVAASAPTNTVLPVISGEAKDEQTVSASTGTWAGSPAITYSYQWEGCNTSGESCVNISSATSSTYTVAHERVGHTLRVKVTATNSAGEASVISAQTATVVTSAPVNTVLPVISGEAMEEKTVTASTGTWAGTPPLEYSYQWEDCDSLGQGCLPISGATGASYQPSAADIGEALVVSVTAANAAGSTAASSEPTAVVMAAECSDTWTGDAGDGSWRTAENWSSGKVPTRFDRACLPGDASVRIAGGENAVGSIGGEGALTISGGSLELAFAAQASSVDSLTLTAGTLAGPGTLDVSRSLVLGGDAVMAGAGSLIVERAATGKIEAEGGCEPVTLTRRSLVNEGTLDYVWGTLFMSDGASLQNGGEVLYDTQSSCYEPQIQTPAASTSPPVIVNAGRFDRDTRETGGIGVSFDNDGSVEARRGGLQFSGGGASEDVATGSWSTAEEGTIVLSGGLFQVAEGVDLAAVQVAGATVERVSAATTQGYLSAVPYAASTVTISGQATGTGVTSASIEVTPAGKAEWQTICGPLTPDAEGAFSCRWDTSSYSHPDGAYQLRAQLTSDASSSFTHTITTLVDNTPPAGSLSATPFISATSTVLGSVSESGSGIASWQLQIALDGSGEWSDACLESGPAEAGEYGCALELDPSQYPEGEYLLRAVITDNAGNVYTTPTVTSMLVNTPPSNTGAPTISGPLQEGQTLTAGVGMWSSAAPISYKYQWRRCDAAGDECQPIEGAVDSTYTLAEADVGATIELTVTATNVAGSSSATSAASAVVPPLAPTNTALPTISGTSEEGQSLSASPGSWSGTRPTFTYQWQLCDEQGKACAAVAGATTSTYLLAQDDVGHTVRVRVTATTAARSAAASSAQSAVITGNGAVAPTNESAPSISGAAQAGQPLRANAGAWSGTQPLAFSYQWQSCNEAGGECYDIQGATAAEYTPQAQDQAATLRVLVTATGPGGSAQAQSAASATVQAGAPSELAEPSISGSPMAGETLSAGGGEWAGSEVQLAYQWQRCDETGGQCQDISGATQAQYVPSEGDVGGTLRVLVGASNPEGSVTALTLPTSSIQPATALVNTWPVSVSGTPQIGATVTADSGSWLGAEGLSFTYQWQSCDPYGSGCEDIPGATEASYDVEATLAGRTLRVIVDASAESRTGANEISPVTQPVAGEGAPVVQTQPAIAGTGLIGHTLTAAAGGWTGEGPIAYSYQWERCNEDGTSCTPIAGASASAYTLGEADARYAIRVLVSATNQHGTGEAVSAPIIAAASAPADVSPPQVAGAYEPGRPLQAGPGIWTGSGAIAFSYEWQRCDAQGEACEAIGGATAVTYTPAQADGGHALRALVTGSAAAGSSSATSPATPAIGTEATRPENIGAPSIKGNLTAGGTLTASAGDWVGSEPISYTYEWQRCSEDGCLEIEGATASTYALSQADVGSALRVLVDATSSAGGSQASSAISGIVGAAGAPANTLAPAIAGRASEGQRLFAENGSWSGSLPLSYYYRWERCDANGEHCTDIDGATKSSYLLSGADVGSTVRLEVTTSNALGSAGARSPVTAVVSPAGQPSTSPAVESIEQHYPSLLARSTTAQIEEQPLRPEIADPGERLTAQETLTSSMISKTTTGEFAVNTAAGEIGLIPRSTNNASELPTIVNGSAALYAEAWRDSDAIVRPTALGETALLQMRSAEAPASFSWTVNLEEHQRLEVLPDGAVAVVEPPPSGFEEPLGEQGPQEGEPSHAPAQAEGEGVSATAAEEERASLVEEAGFTQLPAAPTLATQEAGTKERELHPQDTQADYERDTHAMEYAEAHSPRPPLLVIEPPTVLDANGEAIPAKLTIEEATITLTLSPPAEAPYPIAAELPVTSPTDLVNEARDPVTYGLADPKREVFEPLDKRLKGAPLNIGVARDIVPFDVWQNKGERIELRNWLHAVENNGLEPFLTIEIGSGFDLQTQLSAYKSDVSQLMRALMHGAPAVKEHNEIVEPAVSRPVVKWGAVNEPDNPERSSLSDQPLKAADLWKIADAIAENPTNKCGLCRVAAGEFSEPNETYIKDYRDQIFTDPASTSAKPKVWGFHDYSDLIHLQENEEAHEGNYSLNRVLGWIGLASNDHFWLSEQGLELTSPKDEPTDLEKQYHVHGSKKVITSLQRQIAAANDFLRLWQSDPRQIDLVDYYLYRGPTQEQKEHKAGFDSALVAGSGVPEPPKHREAFCVLVEDRHHGCGTPKSKTGHTASVTATTAMLTGLVNPEELPTTYSFEYGPTTNYGNATTVTELPNPTGEQDAAAAISGLADCTTYHYRVTAENEASEGNEPGEITPSAGEDKTFTTSCGTIEFTLRRVEPAPPHARGFYFLSDNNEANDPFPGALLPTIEGASEVYGESPSEPGGIGEYATGRWRVTVTHVSPAIPEGTSFIQYEQIEGPEPVYAAEATGPANVTLYKASPNSDVPTKLTYRYITFPY